MPRFISMKHFVTEKAKALCLGDAASVPPREPQMVPLGQVIGHVTHVEKKEGTVLNEDGTPKTSYAVCGEFEAIVYDGGRVLESGVFYLPTYYAQELDKALGANVNRDGNLLFGVEISIAPTGKAIPYAYEVRNVTGQMRSRPLHNLKRMMAARGVLRLPAPAELPGDDQPLQIVGPAQTPSGAPDQANGGGGEPEDTVAMEKWREAVHNMADEDLAEHAGREFSRGEPDNERIAVKARKR